VRDGYTTLVEIMDETEPLSGDCNQQEPALDGADISSSKSQPHVLRLPEMLLDTSAEVLRFVVDFVLPAEQMAKVQ